MDSRPIDYQISHTNLKHYSAMCSERLWGVIEIIRTMICFRKVQLSVTCTWEVLLKTCFRHVEIWIAFENVYSITGYHKVLRLVIQNSSVCEKWFCALKRACP